MASLSIGNLSLEIAYSGFDTGWVCYDIACRWRGLSVINPAILEQVSAVPSEWSGGIMVKEHGECSLLPMLRKALETSQSDTWYSLPPDASLALYMNGLSPFSFDETDASRRIMTARAKPDEELPAEDKARETTYVELLVFVDAINFRFGELTREDGVCFRLNPTLEQIWMFYEDLRNEYVAFRAENKVADYLREHSPNYPSDPWF